MARAKRAAAGLSKLTLQDLRAEMLRQRKKMEKLHRQRRALAAKVEKIDEQLGDFEDIFGSAQPPARAERGRAKARRGRPAGKRKVKTSAAGGTREIAKPGTLAAALHSVLQGQVLRVKDAVVAVQSAGYKTKAANLRTMVNQALTKHTHLFKKKGRGKYTSV